MFIVHISARLKYFSALFFGLALAAMPVKAQHIDLDNANAYYNSALFKEAIPLYERVINREASSAQALVRLADCYRYINNLEAAATYYEKALKYSENKAAGYTYAQCLKGLGKYEEAKAWAVRFAQSGQPKDSLFGYTFAANCDFAKNNLANKDLALFSVTNLQSINSKSADYAPTFYKDQLLFSSSRSVPVQKDKEITWTNDAFNQYYLVEGAADALTTKPLRSSIGSDINDAPAAYNRTESAVAITSNNFMDGIRHISGSGMIMDLYLYEATSVSQWKAGSEEFFSHNANVDEAAPFSTGHPAWSPQGDAIYFASNRAGGLGGYDLYVCYKTARGWTLPKNLGFPINTAGDEMCPFVDATGRLFFSSDFHAGFGGMDIFTAERLAWGWGNVQNLGTGVNSTYDDMYFIYQADKQIGYFSSNRADSKGNEDIYMAKQLKAFPKRERQTLALGEQISFYSIEFTSSNELIFSPAEHQRITELIAALNDNPDVLIQIHAFADCRGDASRNLSTSQQRAQLVANYFSNNNVAKTRIAAEGYGEAYPVNNCIDGARCSESQHLLNRRVEITFVGRFNNQGIAAMEYDATPDTRRSPRRGPQINPYTRTRPRPVGSNAATFVSTTDKPINTAPIVGEAPTPTPPRPRPEPKYTNPTTNPTPPNKTPPTTKTTAKTNPNNRKPVRKDHYAIGDQIDIAVIYYEHNKATVDEKNSPGLKQILEVLIDQPYITIEIGSHTDSNGEANYNQELSRKRAEAVKSYLVAKGIPASRLTAKGYGESQLLNDCKDGSKCSDDEHAQNRRTEFVVTSQKGFKAGDIIQVAAINYERNSLNLDMKNSDGLQEIVALLKTNSRITVEIRSHTDANGTDALNLELSEKRAKSVYDYLVKSGIPASRLKYKGYGETMLINRCKNGVKCSDSEHSANRRVDFKVIKVN